MPKLAVIVKFNCSLGREHVNARTIQAEVCDRFCDSLWLKTLASMPEMNMIVKLKRPVRQEHVVAHDIQAKVKDRVCDYI